MSDMYSSTDKDDAVLRRATSSDVDGILRLMRTYPEKILRRPESEIRELLPSFWVLDLAGEIVGCACLEVYGAKICEIRSVAVAPGKTGQGYGQRLISAAVDEARRLKIPQIMVVTSEPNYFEKLGFGYSLNEKFAMFWNGDDKAV